MLDLVDRELTPNQITQLTRVMLAVAHVDGIQTAELALIRTFYDTSRDAAMPDIDVLVSGSSNTIDLPALTELRAVANETVMLSLMTAFADGNLSDGEFVLIQRIASGVGLATEQLNALVAQVKDRLIASLSHLPDAQSVANATKRLKD